MQSNDQFGSENKPLGPTLTTGLKIWRLGTFVGVVKVKWLMTCNYVIQVMHQSVVNCRTRTAKLKSAGVR